MELLRRVFLKRAGPVSERDCARRVSRSKLARSGALGLFRTPLTGRTLLRSATQPRSDGARCSYPLIENDFGIPDHEPVTLFRSPTTVPESIGDWGLDIGLVICAKSGITNPKSPIPNA
jgi:hypothetical protein